MEAQEDFIAFDAAAELDEEVIEDTDLNPPGENKGNVPHNRQSLGNKHENDILSSKLLFRIKTPEWVPMDQEYSKNFITRLDQEIMDFVRYIQPTEAEINMRKLALWRLDQLVKAIFKDSKLYSFGSYAYDLFLPHSDIDVVVVSEYAFVPNCLSTLESELINYGIGKNITVISNSKVPIVKYTDTITNFQFDVSFNILNGVQSVSIVKRMLDETVIGKPAKSLVYVLKQFLMQRNLNEVFTGGIGSYSLLCMIISFLKVF
jgi:non-canonical poly(A) RNA polymerase PAPD5/7